MNSNLVLRSIAAPVCIYIFLVAYISMLYTVSFPSFEVSSEIRNTKMAENGIYLWDAWKLHKSRVISPLSLQGSRTPEFPNLPMASASTPALGLLGLGLGLLALLLLLGKALAEESTTTAFAYPNLRSNRRHGSNHVHPSPHGHLHGEDGGAAGSPPSASQSSLAIAGLAPPASQSIDCAAFIAPIRQRRSSCVSNHTEQVDLCVYFASDYQFVVPFLVHHLSIGVSHIFIYNNDEKVAWYNHPAVLCLVAEEWVDIQPWFGEKVLHKGLDHCYHTLIPDKRSFKKEKDKQLALNHIWGANFDIDEMLVLHKHQCFADILVDLKAPSLAVNWAFFVPEAPLNDFSRSGNIKDLPQGHRLHETVNHIILPHDILIRRMHENAYVYSIHTALCIPLTIIHDIYM
jgi:hypothetical protein